MGGMQDSTSRAHRNSLITGLCGPCNATAELCPPRISPPIVLPEPSRPQLAKLQSAQISPYQNTMTVNRNISCQQRSTSWQYPDRRSCTMTWTDHTVRSWLFTHWHRFLVAWKAPGIVSATVGWDAYRSGSCCHSILLRQKPGAVDLLPDASDQIC
jgi:hypothetical protein